MRDLLYYINSHLILFVLCIGLPILMFTASSIRKKDKHVLMAIVLCTLALAIFEFLEPIFNAVYYNDENFPRYLFASLSYIMRPIIVVLFFYLRFDFKNKKEHLIWIGVLINTAVYILAMFAYHNPGMRFIYWYDEKNMFDRTWLGLTAPIICGIYLGLLITTSIIESIINKKQKQVNIIIIITGTMAVLAYVLASYLHLRGSYSSEAYILGATLFFLYLNYEKGVNDAAMHERAMQEKTTALMLSQIKPHFIYNTLATIQVLCEIDPEKAAKTIEDFSKYLRANTDALNKTEPVPLADEVNHAEAYSKIEMLRFDNVKVIFDIQDKDFKLPVLTIEPLIENAIKYGVRAKEEGIVTVSTYKENNKHILIIKDNGIGFDVNKIGSDGKNHVGIENVKTRINNMVNGTFELNSIIGEGTTITITVPEEK